MQRVLTISQMRAADSYTINRLHISSETLMRRAGIAVAEEVEKVLKERNLSRTLVICGTGNNGGDGYVCADELMRRGYEVNIYALKGKLSEDCAREKAGYTGGYTDVIEGDLIVDCIFGTGLCREVTGEYAKVIETVNGLGKYVVSADIPSGLNGDNGTAEGCAVRADTTVAVAEYKTGYFLNDGPDYCGKIVKKDIGIVCPEEKHIQFPEESDIALFFPKRKRNSHKGTYGTSQLTAGSKRYIGAAALVAESALRSGCGYTKLNTASGIRARLAVEFPQIIFNEEPDLSADCIAIGSGCGVSENLYAEICRLLEEYDKTLIIDADGLNSLSKYGTDALLSKKCEVVLTPHVKEFSRLSRQPVDKILKDPIGCARLFAKDYGVVLLLKSSVSVLTDGERVMLLTRGNSALAKGGSGDMLTGFACGTVARGIDGFDGAAAASFVLGLSAEISASEKTEYCVTAKDLVKNIHNAVKRLTEQFGCAKISHVERE